MKTLSFVLLLALCFAGALAKDAACPHVFDGLTNAHFDLSTQFSTSEISGNWAGLTRSDVLGYEWAVVSQEKFNERFSEECRSTQGFVGIPDVLHWQDVGKDLSATATGLKLTPRSTYYIVLRTTLTNGVHVFSNSNGVVILPQELNLEGSHKRVQPEPIKVTSKRNLEDLASECPLDEANRCRAAAVAPREKLEELYGTPRYSLPVVAFAVPIAGGDDDDDDDDDFNPAAVIIPVVIIGVILLILCCLLLLGLLAAMFSKDDTNKFTENVQTTKTEHVDADFGTTTEHAIADDTRVEFPDYDPSTRLSVA